MNQNPDLGKFKALLARQKAMIDLEEARALPDFTLKGGAKYFNGTDSFAFRAGFSIPLTIFDRNQGNIQAARAGLQRVKGKKKEARRQLMTRLVQAYSQFQMAHKEVKTIKDKILPQARSAFESFQTGYEQGKFDFLQALDAQRTYFSVRLRYLQALSSLHKKKTEVERLVAHPELNSKTVKNK